MNITIIDLGRSKYNGTFQTEDGHSEFEIAGRICVEARKHLRSGSIEVYFDEPSGGTIVAGWRPVGKFRIDQPQY